jgi:hypothetical protein
VILLFSNDGSMDVMIDPSGKVHAFWGLGRVLGAEPDGADTTGFSFFPRTHPKSDIGKKETQQVVLLVQVLI